MLPFSSIGERVDDIARFAAVYCLIAIFFIAEIIALPSPFDGFKLVPFLMITVYFWAAYRPNVLPPVMVFVLGLLADVITGTPIGVGAIILVLLNWAVSSQRAFLTAQSFAMVWLVFGIIYAAITVMQWLVFGLLQFQWPSVTHIMPQFLAGIIAFPCIAAIYHLAYKILPNQNFTLTSR